jgi:protein-disulfide isomerase
MPRKLLSRKTDQPSATILPILTAVLAFASAFATALPWANSAPATTPQAASGEKRPPTASQQRLVEDLLAEQRPYQCCSDSLKVCLDSKPVCPLATRLRRAIVRMASAGLSKAQIEAALGARRATMHADGPAAAIVAEDPFRAGNPKAPVTLAVYACPRNEVCAKVIPDLYREVTAGRLKDKATLLYRPFFPADSREALECGRGLYAAAYQGQFWPYLLHLCLEREHLTQATLRDWAGSHGLDRCIFDQTCERASTAAWLQASRKEGLANGVTAAPAAFINGRRIQGSIDLETLVDLVEEEHERLATRNQAPGNEAIQDKSGRGRKLP